MQKPLVDLDDAKRWFRDTQFWLFVHWGLYAIPAGEWRGRPVPWLGEWVIHTAKIPVGRPPRNSRKSENKRLPVAVISC